MSSQSKTIIKRSSGLITKLILALILGILLATLNLLISHIIYLSPINSILLISSELIFYAILLIIISRPKKIRYLKPTEVKTISQPLVTNIIEEIPIKKIPTHSQINTLNVPQYEFVGSTQNLTYHKRSCKLSKLVKKKYKITNNQENYFKRNNFKPCKLCILKQKK
ncbi:MAG: hypothetical protein AABX11_01170 [Nanoarchaeota archaeon]